MRWKCILLTWTWRGTHLISAIPYFLQFIIARKRLLVLNWVLRVVYRSLGWVWHGCLPAVHLRRRWLVHPSAEVRFEHFSIILIGLFRHLTCGSTRLRSLSSLWYCWFRILTPLTLFYATWCSWKVLWAPILHLVLTRWRSVWLPALLSVTTSFKVGFACLCFQIVGTLPHCSVIAIIKVVLRCLIVVLVHRRVFNRIVPFWPLRHGLPLIAFDNWLTSSLKSLHIWTPSRNWYRRFLWNSWWWLIIVTRRHICVIVPRRPIILIAFQELRYLWFLGFLLFLLLYKLLCILLPLDLCLLLLFNKIPFSIPWGLACLSFFSQNPGSFHLFLTFLSPVSCCTWVLFRSLASRLVHWGWAIHFLKIWSFDLIKYNNN